MAPPPIGSKPGAGGTPHIPAAAATPSNPAGDIQGTVTNTRTAYTPSNVGTIPDPTKTEFTPRDRTWFGVAGDVVSATFTTAMGMARPSLRYMTGALKENFPLVG